jgi:DNA-binding transcriptional ArsR family regulator
MKRDMDLARELLLKLEAEPLDGNLWRLDPDDLGISGRTREEISYHLEQLISGGLLDAERELSSQFVARKLTWAGHDFLDSVRDPKIWRTTKGRVKAAGGFTIEILASVAKKVIEENLASLLGAKLGG